MQLLLVPFERHLYLGDVLGMSGRVQKERTFGVQPSIEVVSVNFFRIEVLRQHHLPCRYQKQGSRPDALRAASRVLGLGLGFGSGAGCRTSVLDCGAERLSALALGLSRFDFRDIGYLFFWHSGHA